MSVTRPTLGRIWANKGDKADPGAEKYAQGWTAEIPTYEVLNFLQNRTDTTLLATAQRGVPEWGPDVTYEQGACAWDNLDKTVYVALVPAPNNEKPPSTNPAHWEVSTMQFTASTHQAIVKKMDDHIADKSNPHKVTANQVGTYDKPTIDSKISKVSGDTSAHVSDKGNPHKVTAAQAGGVPITGGRYTGAVGFDANDVPINAQAGDHSVVAEADRLSLRNKTAKLSIHADGSASANDKKLISEESYPEVRAREEHLYAVPEPDFHMPLVSDIHILEGVGFSEFTRASTATYIDKSGVLRTAGINEPRFEKEGLLIEGQSTNLVTQSEGWGSSSGSTGANAWVHTEPDSQGWRTVTGGTDDGRAEGAYKDFASNTVLWGTTSTFSLDIKKVSGFKVVIRSYNTSNADGFGSSTCSIVDGQPLPTGSTFKVTDMGDWLRVTMTRTFGDSGTSIFRMYPFGSNAGDSGSLTCRRVQVEALPFATSYIPTNGTAVTRAADHFSIPFAYNVPEIKDGNPYTIATEVDFNGLGATGFQGVFSEIGEANYMLLRVEKSSGYQLRSYRAGVAMSTMPVEAKTKYTAVQSVTEDNTLVTAFGGRFFKQVGILPKGPGMADTLAIGQGMSTADKLFGHIRNFRIWHQALTDEQISTL